MDETWIKINIGIGYNFIFYLGSLGFLVYKREKMMNQEKTVTQIVPQKEGTHFKNGLPIWGTGYQHLTLLVLTLPTGILGWLTFLRVRQ